ncbi:MAG: hypothetical protein RLN83_02415 [Balneola sp.]
MKIDSSIHGNKILWRYMDLEKFLDLIINNRIFLSKTSTLSDKYESTLPLNNRNDLKGYLEKRIDDLNKVESKLFGIDQVIRRTKESTYVSSWSMHDGESYALWKIYLNNSRIGVAVKTTSSLLRKSISKHQEEPIEELNLEPVTYSKRRKFDNLLGENLEVNKHLIVTNKNLFYKFEEEARLYTILWHVKKKGFDLNKPGIFLNIDAHTLIDEIYLSPFVNSWFTPLFEKLISSVSPNLAKRVNRSIVSDD